MNFIAERAYPTPLANSTLLPYLLLSLVSQKHTPNTARYIYKEYDFVIVGAGSAGSVVASRLSEISCVSVLLLEAGPPSPVISEVPVMTRAFVDTPIDWAYRSIPQKHCGCANVKRQIVWPSGKTIGGSSVLNDCIYARGNKKIYDCWAQGVAKGWSYDDVMPYFIKLEDNRDPEYLANGFHGLGGPQTLQRPPYHSEIKNPVFETAIDLGYKVVDPNACNQTGFYDLQATLRTGQRCSTAKGYLVPAENRTNLDILPNAMVRKVLINNGIATGVRFDFKGTTYDVLAKKEVIICAGVVNTPQLLMLSGIGPKEELEKHNIPVIANLPVGQNLQDHCATNINFLLSPTIQPAAAKVVNPINIEQYIHYRTGPLASPVFVSAVAFLNRKCIHPKKDFPNYQMYFLEAPTQLFLQLGLTQKAYDQIYGPYEGKPFYACLVNMLHPRSRGTVSLRSIDPYDPPVIDPNYYDDPKDIQDVVDGLKTCKRIASSALMRQVGSTPFQTLVPGCEKFKDNDDKYFRCQTKSVVYSLSHAVGTARMGDPNDPRTVVDPQLRVKTIKRLRVVDASVMPIIPAGNPNIPTIMVAEKASDIIKKTIKCQLNSGYEQCRTTDYLLQT